MTVNELIDELTHRKSQGEGNYFVGVVTDLSFDFDQIYTSGNAEYNLPQIMTRETLPKEDCHCYDLHVCVPGKSF
jgi:hypothetical protein